MKTLIMILFVAYAATILSRPISTKVAIWLARMATIISAILLFYLGNKEQIMQLAYNVMAIGQLIICLVTPIILDKTSN